MSSILRLCSRRTLMALLWVLLVVAIAIVVNAAGIHLAGDMAGWERWMQAHAGHFLVWRMALYAATACGWWWMRRRLRQREPAPETHHRLLRVEISAVLAVALLEGCRWFRAT